MSQTPLVYPPNIEKTCFFFGTFNPIHYGHLLMAECARSQFGFEQILFIPAALPPNRLSDAQMADFHHRYTMVQIACQGNPGFTCSDIESKRPGPSYTLETLLQFFPDLATSDIKIPLIMGFDTYKTLPSWHQKELLIQKAVFLLAPRPSVEPLNVSTELTNLQIQTEQIQMPSIGISASLIRQRRSEQKSIRYMAPEQVMAYIEDHQLYQPKG